MGYCLSILRAIMLKVRFMDILRILMVMVSMTSGILALSL